MNALLSPRALITVSWVLLVASIIGWPLSAFTFAADEPPAILGLSWLAIIFTCWNNIITANVNREVSSE